MANQKKDPSFKPKADKSYLKYTGLATEIVALNLILIWGGLELDSWLGNEFPWMLLLSVLASLVATIYYLLARVK